jgi:hypothetical protein
MSQSGDSFLWRHQRPLSLIKLRVYMFLEEHISQEFRLYISPLIYNPILLLSHLCIYTCRSRITSLFMISDLKVHSDSLEYNQQ